MEKVINKKAKVIFGISENFNFDIIFCLKFMNLLFILFEELTNFNMALTCLFKNPFFI